MQRLLFRCGALFALSLGIIFPSHAAPITFGGAVAGRAPNPSFATPIGPVIADFNSDGAADIATVDANGGLFISFGNTDGSAKTSSTTTGPTQPVAMASADLNGDSKPDLLFAAEGKVKYSFNDGNGAFASFTDVASPDVNVISVRTADFNGDGLPDIVASGGGSDGVGNTVGKVEIYLSLKNGDAFNGYLTPKVFDGGASPGRVAVGDLNGDGFPDVAVANEYAGVPNASPRVTVYFGNPSAIINPTAALLTNQQSLFTYGNHPFAIQFADMTEHASRGGLKRDIIYTSYSEQPASNGGREVRSYVSVVRIKPDNTFDFPYEMEFGVVPGTTPPSNDLAVADVDGDGKPNVMLVNSAGTLLRILQITALFQDDNDETTDDFLYHIGTGSASVELGTTGAHLLASGNLNADNQPDAVVALTNGGGLKTFLNTTNGGTGGGGNTGKSVFFEVSSSDYTEGSNVGAEIKIDRGRDSTGFVTVPFTVSGSATVFNGSNHTVSDYSVVTHPQVKDSSGTVIVGKWTFAPATKKGTLEFAPGEFNKSIFLLVSNDEGGTPDETVIITLNTPITGDAVLGTPVTHTLTIKDKDGSELEMSQAGVLTVAPTNVLPNTTQDTTNKVKKVGRNGSAWNFSTAQTAEKTAPGLALKVQYSIFPPEDKVPNSWQDVPNGQMTKKTTTGTTWAATTFDLPQCSRIWFRTLSSATNRSPSDGVPVGPFRVVNGPRLELTVEASTASDSSGKTTHTDENLTYKLKYKNAGLALATNVILEGAIPSKTSLISVTNDNPAPTGVKFETFNTGGTGVYTKKFLYKSALTGKPEPQVVHWNLGTLMPGQSGEQTIQARVWPAIGFSKSNPTAAFGRVLDFDDSEISATAEGLTGTRQQPTEIETVIESPFEVTASKDVSSVSAGGLITYTFTVRNRAGFTYHNAVFTNRLPAGTFVEKVFNDGDGNFAVTPLPSPHAGSNPSVPLNNRVTQPVITWNMGSIPASSIRTIKLVVRAQYDIPTTIIDKTGSHPTIVQAAEYQFTANTKADGKGDTIPAFVNDPPVLNVSVSPNNPASPPALTAFRFQKTDGVKNDPVLGNIGTIVVPPQDGAGEIAYTTIIANTGTASAVRCIFHDAIPAGTKLVPGSVKVNSVPAGRRTVSNPLGNLILKLHESLSLKDTDPEINARHLDIDLGTIAPGINNAKSVTFTVVLDTAYYTSGILKKITAGKIPSKAKPNGTVGPFITTESLYAQTFATPETLYAQIVPAVNWDLNVKSVANAQKLVVFGNDAYYISYIIQYRNVGGTAASSVKVSCPVPAGTVYDTAYFLDLDGKPRVPDGITQFLSTDKALNKTPAIGSKETAVFNIGNVAPYDFLRPNDQQPAAEGKVEFRVKVDFNTVNKDGEITNVTNISGKFGKNATAAQQSLLAVAVPKLDAAKVGVQISADQEVLRGGKIAYDIIVANVSDVDAQAVKVKFRKPVGTIGGGALHTINLGTVAKNSQRTSSVKLDLAPNAETVTVAKDDCVVEAFNAPTRTTPAIATNVVAELGVGGVQSFGSMFEANRASLQNAEAGLAADQSLFHTKTKVVGIAGMDSLQTKQGWIIYPLGGGNTLVTGVGLIGLDGATLVGNDGASLIGLDGATLIGLDGGTLVAAGAGNLIQMTGLLNGGAATPVSTILQNVSGLVAAGAGNLVAAGGLNLIGLDGATLISNSNRAQIVGNIDQIRASLVAAGAGNLVAAGAGNLVAAGAGNLVFGQGQFPLNNLVSRNGGDILSHNGGQLISTSSGNLTNQNGAGIMNSGANSLIGNAGNALITDNGAGLVTGAGN